MAEQQQGRVSYVRVMCDRCSYHHMRTQQWIDQQRERFGNVYCPACAEVVRCWVRRGGRADDLPNDAHIVIVSKGEPMGPPNP